MHFKYMAHLYTGFLFCNSHKMDKLTVLSNERLNICVLVQSCVLRSGPYHLLLLSLTNIQIKIVITLYYMLLHLRASQLIFNLGNYI